MEQERKANSVLIFFAGAVCGGLAVVLWMLIPFSESAPSAVATTTGTPGLPKDESGLVVVRDQAAGATSIVASVAVPMPGVWVTVREVSGDTLGNVLGAARARVPQDNLEISLLRDTMSGGRYAIVLYRDDGDDQFDLSKDSIFVDFETGKSVVAPFSTR